MGVLAVVLNVVGTICMLYAQLMPTNKIKPILFFSFLSNVIVATGYIAGGSGINGAISCYAGAIMTILNFWFQIKNVQIPKWLLGLYALAFIGLNLLGDFSYLYFIAVVAGLTFVMSISQKDGACYRRWTLLNILLWCCYDILSASYSSLIPHVVILAFTVIGMLTQDRKAKQ